MTADGNDARHWRDGLHRLARGAGQLAERGDELRLLVARGRRLATWTGSSSSAPTATSPTATRCGRRWRASSASSTSPARPRCGPRPPAGVRGQRRRHPQRDGGGAARRGVRVDPHLERRRGRPGRSPGGTADESQPFTAGRLGIAYVNAKHDAEAVAMRVAAKGLPVVVVNPTFVLGPDDPTGTSNGLVRRLLLRRIPAYIDGGLNIVDVRDVARGHLLADERGHEGERYLLSGRNFTLQRLFADLEPDRRRAAAAAEAPGRGDAGQRRGARARRAAGACGARRGPLGDAVVDLQQRQGARELGFTSRPHEETLEDTVALAARAARQPRRRAPRPGHRVARPRRRPPSASFRGRREPRSPRGVLYRCRTPTNFLCPCGAAARRSRSWASSTAPSGSPYRRDGPARDRRAHQAGPRPGAGRRRRGDPRLPAHPPVPRLALREAG